MVITELTAFSAFALHVSMTLSWNWYWPLRVLTDSGPSFPQYLFPFAWSRVSPVLYSSPQSAIGSVCVPERCP